MRIPFGLPRSNTSSLSQLAIRADLPSTNGVSNSAIKHRRGLPRRHERDEDLFGGAGPGGGFLRLQHAPLRKDGPSAAYFGADESSVA
jgi:hypothetical protein